MSSRDPPKNQTIWQVQKSYDQNKKALDCHISQTLRLFVWPQLGTYFLRLAKSELLENLHRELKPHNICYLN